MFRPAVTTILSTWLDNQKESFSYKIFSCNSFARLWKEVTLLLSINEILVART